MSKNVRILNGYRVIYAPEHPSAMTNENWKGYVYEHIYIAENELDRQLRQNEVVHHLDQNRANNRKENLLVLEKSQDGKLHAWISAGAPGLETPRLNGVNSKNSERTQPSYCLKCGLILQNKSEKFCSRECHHASFEHTRKVINRPPYEVLMEKLKTTSMLGLSREYNVSDNAIRKWIKQYEKNNQTTLSQAKVTILEGAETT